MPEPTRTLSIRCTNEFPTKLKTAAAAVGMRQGDFLEKVLDDFVVPCSDDLPAKLTAAAAAAGLTKGELIEKLLDRYTDAQDGSDLDVTLADFQALLEGASPAGCQCPCHAGLDGITVSHVVACCDEVADRQQHRPPESWWFGDDDDDDGTEAPPEPAVSVGISTDDFQRSVVTALAEIASLMERLVGRGR